VEPLLDMSIADHGELYEIVLRGELDVDTAPLALPNLTAAVDAATFVVVDLENLAFIDVFGADALYLMHRRAHAQGHSLVVRGALDHVLEVLRSAGFDEDQP
jgi:anti-anti-sigma factor